MNTEDLGYDGFFEAERQKLGLGDFGVARVLAEYRGRYKVRNEKGEYLAKVTGKRMFQAESREDYPAVGDWVAITAPDEEHAVIKAILPRKSLIKRSHGDKSRRGQKNETQIIAANIDAAFVVESVNRDFSLNRFERYIALAESGGVKPVIVLNKSDLITRTELDAKSASIKARFGDIDIIATSIVNKEGLERLKAYVEKGKTYCFLGSSGVGKSSLINSLLGANTIKTEDIGSRSDRGKHATTARETYFLDNGGIVIDNPGMREVGMAEAEAGISSVFDDIDTLAEKCKFSDCSHVSEPGCAVLEALNSGGLDAERYANYINLKKESAHNEMTALEKREKDKKFGKFMKTAKKELKRYKP